MTVVCPTDFVYESSSCYHIGQTAVNWAAAATYCLGVNDDAHVVSVNSACEQVSVTYLINQDAGTCKSPPSCLKSDMLIIVKC